MKLLLTLLTMILFLTSGAAAESGSDTLASITRKGVLVAGVRESLPPSEALTRRPERTAGTTSIMSTPLPRNSR